MGQLIIFTFIVYHLLHFTFGIAHPDFYHLIDPQGRHDVYSMSVLSFQNFWISAFYVLAMFFLCVHLSHGLASSPQSLGWNREEMEPLLKKGALITSILIFIANSSIPLAVLLGIIRLPGGA